MPEPQVETIRGTFTGAALALEALDVLDQGIIVFSPECPPYLELSFFSDPDLDPVREGLDMNGTGVLVNRVFKELEQAGAGLDGARSVGCGWGRRTLGPGQTALHRLFSFSHLPPEE